VIGQDVVVTFDTVLPEPLEHDLLLDDLGVVIETASAVDAGRVDLAEPARTRENSASLNNAHVRSPR